MIELLERLRADPDDAGAVALYADALLERGDPWGELLALELAGRTEQARRYRLEHRTDLFGDLGDSELPWRVVGNPPRAVELVVRNYSDVESEQLRQLQERGVLVMCERLVLMGSANFDAVMRQVLATDWPCLRTLRLGPLSLAAGRCDVDLASLAAVAPRLEELRVPFPGSLSFGHPALRRLLVLTEPDVWEQLDPARFPELERVEVHFRDDVPDVTRLQHVQIACSQRVEHPDQVAPERLEEDRYPLLSPPEQARERRFERGDRFWSILRDGTELVLRYGKRGNKGRSTTVDRLSPYRASRDYRERVIAKKKEGYVEVWPETG